MYSIILGKFNIMYNFVIQCIFLFIFSIVKFLSNYIRFDRIYLVYKVSTFQQYNNYGHRQFEAV